MMVVVMDLAINDDGVIRSGCMIVTSRLMRWMN